MNRSLRRLKRNPRWRSIMRELSFSPSLPGRTRMKRLSPLFDGDELDLRLGELDFLLDRRLEPDFFFLPFFF